MGYYDTRKRAINDLYGFLRKHADGTNTPIPAEAWGRQKQTLILQTGYGDRVITNMLRVFQMRENTNGELENV